MREIKIKKISGLIFFFEDFLIKKGMLFLGGYRKGDDCMQPVNGYQNEFEIARSFHRKKIKDLNPMQEAFVRDLFPNVLYEDVVFCFVDFLKKKYDIVMTIRGVSKYISIKKGIKNSVHVEGISSFIHFLIENRVPRDQIVAYLKYHYGDGTTNGTGDYRVSCEVYKETHQEEIDQINCFINREDILLKAVDRFVLSGKYHGHSIDVLMFGLKDDFLWIKREDIFKVVLDKKDVYSTAVHFGPLTVQPQNRCLNYNDRYEKGRYCVQVKWYNLVDDIIEFMDKKCWKNVSG